MPGTGSDKQFDRSRSRVREVRDGRSTASSSPGPDTGASRSAPPGSRSGTTGSGTTRSGLGRSASTGTRCRRSPSAPSPSDAQQARHLHAAACHRRVARLGPRAGGGACGRCARGFHHHLRAQPASARRAHRRPARRHVVVDRATHRAALRSARRRRPTCCGTRNVRPAGRRNDLGSDCVTLRGSLVGARPVSSRAVSWGDVASVRSSSGARPPRARNRQDPRIPCTPTRSAGTRRGRVRAGARAR